MRRLFRKLIIVVFSLFIVIITSISTYAIEKKRIVIKAKCVSAVNGKLVVMRNQKIVANFFDKGIKYKKTSKTGHLIFSHRLNHSDLRLNGVGLDNDIIPGCNTGDIQKLKNGMTVVFFGIDCDDVKACAKAGR